MTRRCALLSLLLSVFPLHAHAQNRHPDVAFHLRVQDQRLQRLLQDGLRDSVTLRALVERLRLSDVVVYVDCGGPKADGGRLAFVSVAAGYRYVHVRVARLPHEEQQIAMLGHELQHAVEVADAPGVVDAASLAREYERIGFVNPRISSNLAFDSHAAVDAGYRVLREMARASRGLLRVARGD